MMRTLLMMVVALLGSIGEAGESPGPAEIPDGVVYHRSTKEVLDSARARLDSAFSSAGASSEDVSPFAEAVVCGPVLWMQLRDEPRLQDMDTVPVQFNIPKGDGEFQQIDGRLFRGQARDFLDQLVKKRCGGNQPLKIETPSSHDLALYWGLIPYEIEEPVFILRCGATRWFFDFDESLNILWIDDFTDSARIVGDTGDK